MFGNWNRAEELILGGWQINSIFNTQTGSPVNVIRSNNNDKFYSGLRPDIIGDPTLPKDKRTLDHYFNAAAFDVSRFTCKGCDAFAPGDAGRNLLVGAGYVNVNFSLFKEFAITEGIRLQTRFEAFNTLNTPHFQNPSGDMGNPSQFGKIPHQTRDNMRIVQLAAKIIF